MGGLGSSWSQCLRTIVLVCFFAGILVGSTTSRATTFQGLGDLPGGNVESIAHAISGDGTVVVGSSYDSAGSRAFRWTQSSGMVALPAEAYTADDVSFDGNVIVGTSRTTDGGNQAFRWTAEGGLVGLGDLSTTGIFASSIPYSNAFGVSSDGTIVAAASFSIWQGFIWTSSAGLQTLGTLPGWSQSFANDISADGTVVVGQAGRLSDSSTDSEAFRWSAEDGMSGLGDLPGGNFDSSALGVSANGLVIVGYGTTANGTEAFRWTAADGMIALGDLPQPQYTSPVTNSRAFATSADGSVIVGYANGSVGYYGQKAMRWDAIHGMQALADLLQAQGVDLTGWQLVAATAISANGQTIVGYGWHHSKIEAWRATYDPEESVTPTTSYILPEVSIAGKKLLVTSRLKLRVSGHASGPVTKILQRTGNHGPYKNVIGTSGWHFIASLGLGKNIVSVIAIGPNGSSKPAKIVVWRRIKSLRQN